MALVMGGWDVVRPLAQAGIRCAVFAPPDDPIHRSRLVAETVPFRDPWREPHHAVDALLAFALRRPVKPVLFPPDDPTLMLAARHRERLAEGFRLPLAPSELIEELVDKSRFARLAQRLDLPVPRSRVLTPGSAGAPAADLVFPIVLKPLHRGDGWTPPAVLAKAERVPTQAELQACWPRLAAARATVLAQEEVPGPETRIESFHAFVRQDGGLAGAFTGRKIRTLPRRYGESSAVEITASADVHDLGRWVLERLALTGPVKMDFKRAPDGRLLLLEVNPRFNLWHLPGARAGVNLPALAYADAVRAQPACAPAPPARPGVRWIDPLLDRRAAREHGLSMVQWLQFVARSDTVSAFAWDDPLPLLRGRVSPALRRRTRRPCA
jgi:predicted ATP-grasp superfamily ATP-dependent carboligase